MINVGFDLIDKFHIIYLVSFSLSIIIWIAWFYYTGIRDLINKYK